jgi:pantetheine-phosphate adenylyltransferase
MSTVFYPGSFDPIHLGHVDVVEQAAELFGKVIVAVMHNPDKPSGVFTTDERVAMAREALAHLKSVKVAAYPGLAIDAARTAKADFIVKGLRTPADFEIEQQMAHTNFTVSGVRTVYVPCAPSFGFISSRFIREIAQMGGDANAMVPKSVAKALKKKFPPRRS